MDTVADARQLRIALQSYQYAVTKLPYPEAFAPIHARFRDLSNHQFHIIDEPWLNAYELATLTNYIAMFGASKRNRKPYFSIEKPLNAFKKLWKLAEEVNSYSDNPDYVTAPVYNSSSPNSFDVRSNEPSLVDRGDERLCDGKARPRD